MLNILEVIVGFGFIIAIHEAGHFIAAKRAGITCPVFSVGFPLPRFLTAPFGLPERFRNILVMNWRGTEYRLGWIPFGGFVQMKGQSDAPTDMDDAKAGELDDFRNVSYGNKVAVITGGVIMNAITGVLFFILAFAVFGVTFVQPSIGAVIPSDKDSAPTELWQQNTLKPGDRILSVNGVPIVDFEDLIYESVFADTSVTFTVEREGKQVAVDVPLADIHPRFGLKIPPVEPMANLVVSAQEAERSEGKLLPRDKIVAVEGVEIQTETDLAEAFAAVKPGQSVRITVLRKDLSEPLTIDYQPRRSPDRNDQTYFGFVPEMPVFIKALQDNEAASKAGLKAGDQLLAWREVGTETWNNLYHASDLRRVVREREGKALEIRWARHSQSGGGEPQLMSATMHPRKNGSGPRSWSIGVIFMNTTEAHKALGIKAPANEIKVATVLAASPAEAAGLRPGDVITDVPSIPPVLVESRWFGLSGSATPLTLEQRIIRRSNQILKQAAEGEADGELPSLELTVRRENGETANVTIHPSTSGDYSSAALLVDHYPLRSEPVFYGLGTAVTEGFSHSHKKVVRILETLQGLVSGEVSPVNLAGPVMIAKASYDLTEYGFGTLLFFLGFISINLAIVNILPIPVLDGGLLLVATIEKLKGSPLNQRVMGAVNFAAFLFVIGLMLFLVFNDVRTLTNWF